MVQLLLLMLKRVAASCDAGKKKLNVVAVLFCIV